MNNEALQIVKAYEEAGMSPEEIQEGLFQDMEVATIKAALFQFSAKWRALHTDKTLNPALGQQEIAKDVTEEEFQLIKGAYKQLALHSENEEIKARALKWLWNEHKGRNEPKQNKQLPNITFNVAVFNEHMKQAKKAIATVVEQPKSLAVADYKEEKEPIAV